MAFIAVRKVLLCTECTMFVTKCIECRYAPTGIASRPLFRDTSSFVQKTRPGTHEYEKCEPDFHFASQSTHSHLSQRTHASRSLPRFRYFDLNSHDYTCWMHGSGSVSASLPAYPGIGGGLGGFFTKIEDCMHYHRHVNYSAI